TGTGIRAHNSAVELTDDERFANWVQIGGSSLQAVGYSVGGTLASRNMMTPRTNVRRMHGIPNNVPENPIRQRVLANIAESQRARASSGFAEASRQWTARSFYENTGWSNQRINSHIRGIDFTRPVSVATIRPGEIYVNHTAGGLGNYFAEIGTPVNTLGINPAGRVPVQYSPRINTSALRSTAASVLDTWSVPSQPFEATGGGIQFFIPNNQLMVPLQ
ncbi:MAG: hypothetical protein JJU05_19480, partial [Verrucomicrobia bacterium]|nr:hypothetical protein [Verrucomicrobiota bacterium]